MAKILNANTIVRASDGTLALLTEGMPVPRWAADQVGEHLLTSAGDPADTVDEVADLRRQLAEANAAREAAEAALADQHDVDVDDEDEDEDEDDDVEPGELGEPGEPGPAGDSASKPPPRAGAGSDRESWAAYATRNGVDVAADAKRDEIIAALDTAGVPTK
ncbi:hypothetical protein ABZS66_19200 [Dactylosporangium sp. NPDC005572]|uniref:hypothetical protein n=1 Tax=Dactylosporangium sp. NPDC005572 TaxID=3156889 RepID=UPI0033A8E51A